jgi:hypothetical protein
MRLVLAVDLSVPLRLPGQGISVDFVGRDAPNAYPVIERRNL